MNQNRISDFHQYLEEWSQDLELLRQNWLLNESAFINFARDRGLTVRGVVTGDLGDFHKRGWLTSDGTDYNDGPLFHPFRIYPLQSLLRDDQMGEVVQRRSQATDLAILLEPIYWPRITGQYSFHGISESDYEAQLDQYRRKALHLVSTLDPLLWREIHKCLRIDAAQMDENSELYLLLRLATWNRREQLKGHISGALWIRHIAEVIRRAFEEVHTERWPEEDQAFGERRPGVRERAFGSERPLDDELLSKPYLAWEYGLFTGSVVRWYVEGETEYYAILQVLPKPPKSGIELVNLRGVLKTGGDNIALKLQDWLMEDRKLRRFSMISFDSDEKANIKAIQRQVEQQHVVGFIAAHEPDFEFANFAILELVEVAARIDEADGYAGDAVRKADWTSIRCGKKFEERYKTISERKRGLKGEKWGRALAKYASEYPNRSDNGNERPFWHQIGAALRCGIASYDVQKERFRFNPNTFELEKNDLPESNQIF